MTMYDALMLLIVIVAVMQGAWRGMVWQIAPIASLILGYIVATPMSVTAAQYFGAPPLNRLWAMLAIYAVVSMAVYLFVRSLRESLERMKLVEFDRHLGGLLGAVKGVLFTVALTIGLITISDDARDIILKSESVTIAARIMNTISPILPDQLNNLVKPYVKNLNDQLPEIADNPTFELPLPTLPNVLTPPRTATNDRLAKPKRFDDDGDLPPPRGDLLDDFSQPSSRTLRSTPQSGNPFEDFDAPPSSLKRTSPQREPLNDDVPLPPLGQDDFFGADPDAALKSSKRVR
ncbi:MAG TPA: CvpA family protein [Planctomycetaceae bacterium]|nr:CvpA family protein [Planctomycetaceae bacterium]